MTYHELNDKLFDLFADKNGSVEGDYLDMICEISALAAAHGDHAEMDEAAVKEILNAYGAYRAFSRSLPREKKGE